MNNNTNLFKATVILEGRAVIECDAKNIEDANNIFMNFVLEIEDKIKNTRRIPSKFDISPMEHYIIDDSNSLFVRSLQEIINRIDELKKDVRYSYPPAIVEINAPLALVQTAIKSEIRALEWVLNLNKRD